MIVIQLVWQNEASHMYYTNMRTIKLTKYLTWNSFIQTKRISLGRKGTKILLE